MTMPIPAALLALVIGISAAMYFYLRPLEVFSRKEWLISHGFIIAGLVLILGWLWFNRGQFEEITMLMGGSWTVAGGLCFAVVYVVRKLKN